MIASINIKYCLAQNVAHNAFKPSSIDAGKIYEMQVQF